MAQVLGETLDYLMRVGVEYNLHQSNYWGVLFSKKDGVQSATITSPFYAIQVEGLDIEPQGEFYSYFENAWTKNPYPVSVEEVLVELSRKNEFVGKIIVPFTNLVNRVGTLTDLEKKKTRLIFAPGVLEQGEVLLKFTNMGGIMQSVNSKIPKPFLIDRLSFISHDDIKNNAHVYYRCRIVGMTDDAYLVTCLEPFGKVRIGLHYSESGFIPDNMDEINSLSKIPKQRILFINTVEPQNLVIPPIHVDCSMFLDVVKVMGLSGTSFLEIHVGNHYNHPILIRNIRNNDKEPQISIMYATLNLGFGPQRR